MNTPTHPSPTHIRIFDTTLRDGEQSPGCSMTPQQKLVMARGLAELGVDAIETGFPASSQSDREAHAMIARELRETTLVVLSRCLAADIETSLRTVTAAAKPRHQQEIGAAAGYLDMDFSIAEVDAPDFSWDCFGQVHGAAISASSPCCRAGVPARTAACHRCRR